MGAVIHCSMRSFIGLDFFTGSFHFKNKNFFNATHLIIIIVSFLVWNFKGRNKICVTQRIKCPSDYIRRTTHRFTWIMILLALQDKLKHPD